MKQQSNKFILRIWSNLLRTHERDTRLEKYVIVFKEKQIVHGLNP